MSKKFLLSTAFIFALLAGKSFATEANKPFESEDITSTALVIPSPSIRNDESDHELVPYINNLPEEILIHIFNTTSYAV